MARGTCAAKQSLPGLVRICRRRRVVLCALSDELDPSGPQRLMAREQTAELPVVESSQQLREAHAASVVDVPKDLVPACGDMNDDDSSVVRFMSSLDEAARLHPIDDARRAGD